MLAQRFALDILKLNRFGFRSNRFIPSKLDDFNIFGEELFSPISGVVLRAENTKEDLSINDTDSLAPAGNHVIIRAENTDRAVILAHLQKGSVRVKEGDFVKKGELLGKIGNSGNTSEPHLHIHCVEINETGDFLFEANPVSMIFNGVFLVRNNIVSEP